VTTCAREPAGLKSRAARIPKRVDGSAAGDPSSSWHRRGDPGRVRRMPLITSEMAAARDDSAPVERDLKLEAWAWCCAGVPAAALHRADDIATAMRIAGIRLTTW